MAAFHRTDRGLSACVKGAPGRILDMSSQVYDESAAATSTRTNVIVCSR